MAGINRRRATGAASPAAKSPIRSSPGTQEATSKRARPSEESPLWHCLTRWLFPPYPAFVKTTAKRKPCGCLPLRQK